MAATRLHYKCHPRTPGPFDHRTVREQPEFKHRRSWSSGRGTHWNAEERSSVRGCGDGVFRWSWVLGCLAAVFGLVAGVSRARRVLSGVWGPLELQRGQPCQGLEVVDMEPGRGLTVE